MAHFVPYCFWFEIELRINSTGFAVSGSIETL